MSKTKNLAIYRPNGAAAEYSTWACNLYNGCSHTCVYCYCKRGVFGHTLGKDVPEVKTQLGGNPDKAYSLFCQELNKYHDQIIADGGLFFSFSTDPMLREEIDLTMRCVLYALENKVPVSILTKATWWVRVDWIIGSLWQYRDILRLGFTFTGHDEMEPGAPSNVSRQTALIYLHKMQFRTFASMEPIIDFVSSLAVIRTIATDCNEFRIGLLSPFRKDRYKPEHCSRFILAVDTIAKEHGFVVYWKQSVRRYVNDYVLPFLCTEADAFAGSDMGLDYAQKASDIQRIIPPVPSPAVPNRSACGNIVTMPNESLIGENNPL